MKLERQPLKNDFARLRSCELDVHVSKFAHVGGVLRIAWKFEALIDFSAKCLGP